MGYLMGIDLGTSSVKVLIADEAGQAKGIGQVGYDVLTPQVGHAEQDPEVWWNATKQAITGALEKSGVAPADIAGLGFSGQMHGMVAVDQEGIPVYNAIIHLDQRSLVEKEEIYAAAGNLLSEELLNRPSAGMMICSLYWLKKQMPRVYDRIHKVMSPKDYINYRLTGVICSDPGDAGAGLAYSVKNKRWCTELMERLGINPELFATVHESTEIVAQISAKAAAETGLSEMTKVVPGTGDSMAQMVGNGVVEAGIMACNIGTSSQLAVVTDKPIYDKNMICQLWCHGAENTWVYQGGALNGGSTLSWLRNKVLRDQRPFAELDAEAAKIPAGCEGLMFLPYLAGERTPFNDPQARGVYFGLSMKHDQAYMVRSTMEGIMFNLCECQGVFNEMGITQTKVISAGGASKGVTWKQIQADMLNMPIHTTQTQEEACLGAAILAAVGVGIYPDVKTACRQIVTFSPEVTEPIAENVKIYREKQQIFHDLYFTVKDMYPRL